MRRLIVISALFLGILAAGFGALFAASGYWTSERGLRAAVADFLYVPRVFFQRLTRQPVPHLTDERYRATSERLRRETNTDVRRAARDRLVDWGPAIVPRLLAELESARDPVRRGLIAQTLGYIGDPRAIPALAEILETAPPNQVLEGRVTGALGRIGHPDAGAVLIGRYERALDRGEPPPYGILDDIGRTGGVGFLLEQLETAQTPERFDDIADALALTRDPQAVEALILRVHHELARVRARASRALGTMGEIAVTPVMDLLEAERDDYLRADLISEVFGKPSGAADPRVVPWLASLLTHRGLGDMAARALARIDTPDSVAALDASETLPAQERVKQLGKARRNGPAALAHYLSRPDGLVRWQAMQELVRSQSEDASAIVAAKRDDPQAWIRREADDALLYLDKFRLWQGLNRLGGVSEQRRRWTGWHRPLGHFGRPVRAAQGLAVMVCATLGVLLILNLARPFESYRFHLVAAFLILEGFLGAFLFLDEHYALYRLGVGATLLLLVGYYVMERVSRPDATRQRLGRMGGAALWLLVPALMWLGVPILSEALRGAFRSPPYFLAYVAAMAMVGLLLVEEYLVPWRLAPRRARGKASIVLGVSAGLFALIAWPVLGLQGSETDLAGAGRLPTAILILLTGLMLFQVGLLIRSVGGPDAPSLPPSPGLRVMNDGKLLSLRPPSRRSLAGLVPLLPGLALLGATAWHLGAEDLLRHGHAGTVVAMIFGALGLLMTWGGLLTLLPRRLLQVREGQVRDATTLFGLALWGGQWRRRPRVETLSGDQRKWLRDLLQRGPRPSSRGDPSADLDLKLQGQGRLDRHAGRLTLAMEISNTGTEPISAAEVEAAQGTLVWSARIGDRSLPLSLSGAERRYPIAPGGCLVVMPWVWLPAELQQGSKLPIALACRDKRSNTLVLNLETAVDRSEWLASDCIADGY